MSGAAASKRLIYFCGSMRAGRQDVDLYGTLVGKLGRYFWGLFGIISVQHLTGMVRF